VRRRRFLSAASLAMPTLSWLPKALEKPDVTGMPLVISTWAPNVKANAEAWKVLNSGGNALDAVEAGVKIPEADPEDQSVGLGGLPDRDGRVTLDSCIMDFEGNCGAVMALEEILHPVSVARMVMEKTPHIQLAGEGALQFALEMGFKRVNLLTEKSKETWKKWLETAKYNPMTTLDNLMERIKNQHDTIGMLALDQTGNLAGACTTSGMAFKMRGRVGDSPIIGAGLYVDNEVGSATATGVGEEVVRICGSHTVVELMRQGRSPEEACKEAVGRLVKMRGFEKTKNIQLGFIAMNKEGDYGCYGLYGQFSMAVQEQQGIKVIQSKSWY